MIKATADVHIERKLTHFFGVMAMVLLHALCPPWLTWVLFCSIGVPLVLFDVLRLKNEKLKQLTPHLFGMIMRRKELNHITGTTYLILGTLIILLFFPHPVVSLALLFLATADPLASYVGINYGTVKIVGKKATLHLLDTADHSFKILKRTRQSDEDVFVEMARVTREWADGLKLMP